MISHSSQSPFVAIGTGNTSFESVEGNVNIDHYTASKEPLRNFRVTKENDEEAEITFFGSENGAEVSVRLFSSELHDLEVEFKRDETEYNRVWIRLFSDAEEKLFGAGEQFSHFNLKGRTFPIWTREQGKVKTS